MKTSHDSPADANPADQPDLSLSPHGRAKRRILKPVSLTLLALAVVAWLAHLGVHAYHYEGTDDAYIVGHLHQVSAQIDGQVKAVHFEDNQRVAAGDVLVELDPLARRIAVQKATGGLALARAQKAESIATESQANAQIAITQARASQAESEITQARAQLKLARLTLDRAESLLTKSGAVTQADLDSARSNFQARQAAAAAAEANLAATRADIAAARAAQSSAHAQTIAADANIATAEAVLRDAQRELANTTITAPASGRIGNRNVETGNSVKTGQTLLALVEPQYWIVANFKETQLARMHPGQSVEFTIDSLPGQTLRGTIDSLSPASGAQFALLPPDNATGNFNKVVQRVPVKITIPTETLGQISDRLRLGLSVIVDVRVR